MFGLTPALTRIVLIVVGLLLIIALTLGYCSQREKAQKARDAQTQAEGRTVSATEAIQAINDLGERSNATDAQVENATDAIRQANPADRDAVFRYHVCLLQHRTDCDRL